ncbi:putative Peptide methionine sulfoxide reductase MsrA [Blattamonas nauphoetae]|uniref:peptide-methionine (S)-S-oxide reductase n=1 Tax=Blattamonas nauphoetae TaxID=2049346 RepID=A0ABQ9X6I5_9EUKA|nr:putative Peptide methionine sulfoxide reductase MsrA [Blattamonas nauphoetae]
MKRIKGVASTCVGFANGHVANPTYQQVCTKTTGHAETVKITYDPSMISLPDLLKEFFTTINPTQVNRQANDIGEQYRSGIYFSDPTDEAVCHAAVAEEQTKHSQPVATEVKPLSCFYPADESHQDYLDKNPDGYCHVDLSRFKK